MDGRWKLLDIGPVRLAREKRTRNTVRSLSNVSVLVIRNPYSVMTVEVVRKLVL
jgi:hypothetical protein